MDEAVKLAIKNNHRVRGYRHQREARHFNLKSKKAEFLPDLDLSYTYTSLDEASLYQTKESSIASIEAKYNLFNGFIDTNNMKEAGALLDAASYKEKSIEADIVFEVKIAYIELLRAKKNLDVSVETVKLLERERQNAGFYFREGIIAKNELLKVEVELASVMLTRLQGQSSLTTAMDRLEMITGAKAGDLSEPSDLLEQTISRPDYKSIYDYNILHRTELRYLQAIRDAKKFEIKSLRGEYLPAIDLALRQSSFGDEATPSGRAGEDDETRGEISATWKLFAPIKKGYDVESERAEFSSIEEAIAELEDDIRFQLKSAVEEHRLAMGKLIVAEKGITHAEENYRITENQFRQQIATTTDILDAGAALSSAKNDYNNARYDLQAAIARIERITEGFSL